MGSVVRDDHAQRYIEEFALDIVDKLPVRPDDSLRVAGVYLEFVEPEEQVWSVIQLEDAKGKLHDFRFACVFDPESDGEEDTIERLSAYDIDEDEARRRLKRAKLF